MRGWLPSLKDAASAGLRALGDQLKPAVEQADLAVTALSTARQRNRDFRTIGERKAFIDATNALRKSTYGALAELPHKHPEKNLPNTFAESFFKRTTRRKAAEDEPGTAAELTTSIARMEEQLAVLKAKYTEVLAAEETEARAKAQRETDAAALAEAEKEAEAVFARVSALRAKLGR
jgi:hypothetical protein